MDRGIQGMYLSAALLSYEGVGLRPVAIAKVPAKDDVASNHLVGSSNLSGCAKSVVTTSSG